MDKPKLILFDFGGVLIDYSQSFQTASQEQGISVDILDNVFDANEEELSRGILTPEEMFKIAIELSSLDEDLEYDFIDSWVRDYKTIQPSYDLLIELSKKYPVGLLTNIYKGVLKKTIELNKLPDINYNYIFESCEIGYRKPEFEMYNYVEKKTGLNGNEILFIDDRQDFIEGAQVCHWRTVLFDNTNPVVSVEDIYKILDGICC